MALKLGEAGQRFSPCFEIEEMDRHVSPTGFARAVAVCLMTREPT